jgi:hypothetical protein
VALPQDYPPFAIAPRRRVSQTPDPFTNACGGALNLRVGGCFIALPIIKPPGDEAMRSKPPTANQRLATRLITFARHGASCPEQAKPWPRCWRRSLYLACRDDQSGVPATLVAAMNASPR